MRLAEISRVPAVAGDAADTPECAAGDGPGVALDGAVDNDFRWSTCGRTDLPRTSDWDPPICLECDAALNFEEIELTLEDC